MYRDGDWKGVEAADELARFEHEAERQRAAKLPVVEVVLVVAFVLGLWLYWGC